MKMYLLRNGYKTKEQGGNVEVISAQISDIFTLMQKKQIDGAWVPEPWGAKFVKEAGARIFLDERSLWPHGEYVTANIIARTDYLNQNLGTVEKFLTAKFTYDPIKSSLITSAQDALKIGFLRIPPNLTGIYDLSLLNKVLQHKGLIPIP